MKSLRVIFVSFLLIGRLSFVMASDTATDNCTMTVDISGQVWLDSGDDGLLTSESGISGVVVHLVNSQDQVVGIDTTTGGGYYEFTDVPEGDYYLEIPASNFLLDMVLGGAESCRVDGSPLEIDNDDNGIGQGQSPRTEVFAVEESMFGQTIDYIDFCFEFDCDLHNPLALPTCEEANMNVVCNLTELEGFCSRMPETNSGGSQPSPLCPSDGAATNISWFAFVAGSENYDLVIDPFACSGSTSGNEGVQIGVYTSCSFDEAVFCDPSCNLSSVTIPSTDLEAGATYYIFIDGCNGSVCSYTIEIEGDYSAPPPFNVDDICIGTDQSTADCSDPTICVNQTLDLVLTGIDFELEYIWSVDGVQEQTSLPNYQVTFDAVGTYEVCLELATSGCFDFVPSNMCRTVTVTEGIPDEYFGTVTICEEDLAIFDPVAAFQEMDPNSDGTVGWQAGMHMWALGENSYEVSAVGDCTYQQSFELVVLPVSQTNIDTILCQGDTILGLTEPGIYQLSFPDVNGCDSTVSIDLTFLPVSDPHCNNTKVVKWTYNQNQSFGFPFPPIEQRVGSIAVIGDTIIAEEEYSVIEGGCHCSGSVRYIREEGLQTYIYHSGEKHLLYDYSLQAGDVLSIATPYLADQGQDSAKVRVESVSTVTYKGVERIQQHVDPIFTDESQFWSDWGRVFVQGVGSIDWCMFPQYGLCEIGTGGVRCVTYDDGATVKLTSDADCEIKSDLFPLGSKWTYRQWGSADPDPLRIYRIVREDLIADDTYKILAELDNNNQPIAGTEIRLQTSRDQVFFLDDSDSLRLMYDFSTDLAVGDTVTYYLPSNANLYDISSNGGMEEIRNPYQYVIEEIGSVEGVNISNIKEYAVRDLPREESGELIGNASMKIVEGVGGQYTLIRRGLAQVLGGIPEKLICYNGSFEYDYMLNATCDLTATSAVEQGVVAVHPNPTYGMLQIITDRSWAVVHIYDITGALKMTLPYDETIDISSLASGFYYLHLQHDDQSTAVRKFVKI